MTKKEERQNITDVWLDKISIKQPELDIIAEWRNSVLETLRTSDLTPKGISQEQWVNSLSDSEKYYFIYSNNIFVGYCGLDKIHPSNRTAEISLLVGHDYRKTGIGRLAINKLLTLGFDLFNLNLIYGEAYLTTTNKEFWLKLGFKKESTLRQRKYFGGKYYDSIIFSMSKEEWENK